VLTAAIESFLRRHQLTPRRVAVAVSGGRDSTALLVAFAELQGGPQLHVIHVNHHLRGEASDGDEAFVRALCERLALPLTICDGTLDPQRRRDAGLEGAARERRYERLLEVAAANGCDLIATAHHRRDQAETVLLRLLTGSGILRLRGIDPLRNGLIIRPLLDVSSEEIDQFLRERDIVPRQDETNSDTNLLRNRIRHELLPLLRTYNPRIEEALAETARQTWELEHDVNALLRDFAPDAVTRGDNESAIDRAAVERLPWVERHLLLRELLRLDPEARDLSASDLRRITAEEARRASVTKRIEVLASPEAWSVRRRGRLTPAAFEVPLDLGEEIIVEAIKTRFRLERAAVSESLTSAQHQLLELPPGRPSLLIRSRKAGDRFFPLGAPGEKKLSRFLIDRRIDRSRRDSIPLLVIDNQIAAVIGVEVSERFKVSHKGEAYRLSYERI
jgi:tRNA(Ile)-lysidine synthase